MDIRELNLFLHLSNTLNYGQTSRACNITRSGLTRTIQRLEQQLDQQLLLRDNRSVALTRAGELFRKYAGDVVERHRKLQMELASDDALRGELSLYCSVTAILSILPAIISRFRQNCPGVHLNLQTGDAAMALPRLLNGEADITIAALPDRLPRQVSFLKLLETPLIFIGPNEEDAPGLQPVDWSLVPVIMPERGLGRERCERWFARKGLSPLISSYVAGNEAMIAMVAMGCGVGAVPRLVLENSPLNNQVKVLDVRPALEAFTVGACTSRAARRNPIVQAFWQIAVEQAEHSYHS